MKRTVDLSDAKVFWGLSNGHSLVSGPTPYLWAEKWEARQSSFEVGGGIERPGWKPVKVYLIVEDD